MGTSGRVLAWMALAGLVSPAAAQGQDAETPPAPAETAAPPAAAAKPDAGWAAEAFVGYSEYASYYVDVGPEYGVRIRRLGPNRIEPFLDVGIINTYRWAEIYPGPGYTYAEWYGWASFWNVSAGGSLRLAPATARVPWVVGASAELLLTRTCSAEEYRSGVPAYYNEFDCSFSPGVGFGMHGGARWQRGRYTVGAFVVGRVLFTRENWDDGAGDKDSSSDVFAPLGLRGALGYRF